MSTEDFAPRQLMVLADEPRIRGYLHPARMAILRMLSREKRTITSVAREMTVHPANLTHHFKLLQRLGLIRLVETRDTGRNLEKYYVSVARNFVVRPKARTTAGKQALALSVLRDNLSVAIDRSRPGARAGHTLALLASARLCQKDVARFVKRLRTLVAEFQRADSGDGRSYSLNTSLYPDEAPAMRPEDVRVELR